MVKRSGVFEISTVIFVLFSLTFIKGDITRVSAIEGGEIGLNFSYPSECTRVTLRNGMRAPFYDSANLESLSLPENQELAFQNESESNTCLLQFNINPVLRSDEGGYILTAYDGDGSILEDTRVGLRVDYPPGKASCEWGELNIVDDWGSMRCKAPAGSMPGQIACHQNGIGAPPAGKLRNGDRNLEQNIWLRRSQPAFCCATVAIGQPVERCKCKDYIWDPCSDLTEPCPAAMVTAHHEASTSSQSPISIPSQEVTQITKNNHWSNAELHVGLSCVIGMFVIIIIGLCIALRMSNRKAYRVKKNAKITHPQPNHVHMEYKSVETAEM